MFRKISSLLLILTLILSSFHYIGIVEASILEDNEKPIDMLIETEKVSEDAEIEVNEVIENGISSGIEVQIEENLIDENNANLEVEIKEDLADEKPSEFEGEPEVKEESSEEVVEKDNGKEENIGLTEHSTEAESEEQPEEVQIETFTNEPVRTKYSQRAKYCYSRRHYISSE